MKQIDPAVLDYAATRLQAGFRGYQTRKNMKKYWYDSILISLCYVYFYFFTLLVVEGANIAPCKYIDVLGPNKAYLCQY